MREGRFRSNPLVCASVWSIGLLERDSGHAPRNIVSHDLSPFFSGLGPSHQSCWKELVAKSIQLFGFLDASWALEWIKRAAFEGSTTSTR